MYSSVYGTLYKISTYVRTCSLNYYLNPNPITVDIIVVKFTDCKHFVSGGSFT